VISKAKAHDDAIRNTLATAMKSTLFMFAASGCCATL
jgi:hypothetical protein